VVYVGHDGLIDFSLPLEFPNPTGASKSFFKDLPQDRRRTLALDDRLNDS